MGAIRSTPESHINIASDKENYFSAVTASTCGWEQFMEDYMLSFECNNTHFLAIFDGHGGPQIAEFCRDMVPIVIEKNQLIGLGQIQSGLESVISTLDEQITKFSEEIIEIQKKHHIPAEKEFISRSGCSLIICAINEENVIIGNVGNCKGYVCYRKDPTKAVLISGNHSITNQEDEKRISKAGGYFLHDKLNGMLPFTRSIGNLQFKSNQLLKKHEQLLVSIPSIFNLRREDIQTIVLGSSGLWERPAYVLNQLMKNQNSKIDAKEKVGVLLEELIAANPKATNGLQNMATILISIKHE